VRELPHQASLAPEQGHAFRGRVGGGVMIFGLNEQHDFEIVGVGNAHGTRHVAVQNVHA
jgi:hypothetical protein